MNFFTGFFKLIRGVNLLYIALTQVLLQYCVVWPVFSHSQTSASPNGLTPTLLGGDFFLLVLSTLLIAASGYMINDYFDVKIDEVNKPERILVDRLLPRRKIMILHVLFNVLGVLIGFYLAWKVGQWQLGFVHVVAATILWFYSVFLKKQFLIGNLAVSLLTALVVFTVWVYEPQHSQHAFINSSFGGQSTNLLMQYFIFYALFAFSLNLIRELLKDMEDIEGDKLGNCRTVPIVLGIKKAKTITSVIILGVISCLSIILFTRGFQFEFDLYTIVYAVLLVQLPLVYILSKLYTADKSADFKHLSYVVKGIMLSGILYLILFATQWRATELI